MCSSFFVGIDYQAGLENPVTGRNSVVLGPVMLTGMIRKPTLSSCFTTEGVIPTTGFGDIIRRDRLELISEFSHFANNKTISNVQGMKALKCSL
jgi:hypothetical protein